MKYKYRIDSGFNLNEVLAIFDMVFKTQDLLVLSVSKIHKSETDR